MLAKMLKGMADDEKEMESPEESSLSDLIGMLEEVISKKGMSKKKPVQMSIEVEAGEPEEKDAMEMLAGKDKEEEDEDDLKSKLFG